MPGALPSLVLLVGTLLVSPAAFAHGAHESATPVAADHGSHASEPEKAEPKAAHGALVPTDAKAPSPSPTPDVPVEEVKVTLLGQPCLMQGPIPPEALRQVHSASPDQIYPVEPTDLQIKRALDRIRAVRKLPSFLDRYRERLTLRLEAQHAFFDALERARRSAKAAPLFAVAKRHFQAGHSTHRFDALARKYVTEITGTGASRSGRRARSNGGTKSSPDTALAGLRDGLWNEYGLHIEADPEEEFHRATQGAGIRYDCSFEGGDVDDEDENPVPAAGEASPSALPSASPAAHPSSVPSSAPAPEAPAAHAPQGH